MSLKNKITDVDSMVKLADFFMRMSEYQYTFKHPKMALDSYVTAKTLLFWAKVGLEEKH